MFRKCLQVFLLFLFLIGFSKSGKAQRTFGVAWDVPSNYRKALNQLHTFDSLGITHLQINRRVNDRILQQVQSDSFKVFLSIPNRFVLPGNKVTKDTLYKAKLEALLEQFHSYDAIGGVGLFQFGALHSSELLRQYRIYVKAIKHQTDLPVYFTTAQPPTNQFKSLFDLVFYQFHAQKNPRWSLFSGYIFEGSLLREPYHELGFLLKKTSAYSDKPIFFTSNWLLKSINQSPELAHYLKTASSDSIALYPFGPEHGTTSVIINWIVVLLLITWTTFALNYSINPIYRRNLLRYFTAHKFFTRDIINRHIRIPYTALILFFQHIFICGLWMYALARHFYTSLGVAALRHHYPMLEHLAIWPLSFFLLGLVFAFILQSVSILCLYFFTNRLDHICQPILLYSWPLQLNLITATVLTPITISGGSNLTLRILTILFIIIWIGSYLISTLDIASFLGGEQYLYVLSSVGIITLLLGAGLYYFYFYTKLPSLFYMITSFI